MRCQVTQAFIVDDGPELCSMEFLDTDYILALYNLRNAVFNVFEHKDLQPNFKIAARDGNTAVDGSVANKEEVTMTNRNNTRETTVEVF